MLEFQVMLLLYWVLSDIEIAEKTVLILSSESIWSVMGFRNFNLTNLVHTHSKFHN